VIRAAPVAESDAGGGGRCGVKRAVKWLERAVIGWLLWKLLRRRR
jgi:hypothetical protein